MATNRDATGYIASGTPSTTFPYPPQYPNMQVPQTYAYPQASVPVSSTTIAPSAPSPATVSGQGFYYPQPPVHYSPEGATYPVGTYTYAQHTEATGSAAAYGYGYAPAASDPMPAHSSLSNTRAEEAVHKPRDQYAEEAVAHAAQHWVQQQLQHETERKVLGIERPLGTDVLNEATSNDTSIPPHLRRRASAKPRQAVLVPGSPLYTKRLALLLGATLFGVIPLMSSLTLTVLLCGMVLTYMSDLLGYHRATVLVLILSAITFSMTLLITNIHVAFQDVGPFFMICDLAGVLLAAVGAGLLHFRWLQKDFPELVCTLERWVMCTTPVLGMPSLLTTVTALVGSRYAPFFFFFVLCAEHHFFYSPLRSAFLMILEEVPAGGATEAVVGDDTQKPRPSAKGESEQMNVMVPQQLNGRLEAVVFTMVLLVLPTVVYNAFQSNWMDHILANVLNSAGLVCGGVVFLCLSPEKSFWFFAPQEDNVLSRLEYDPLGLHELAKTYSTKVLALSSILVVPWAAYRLVHSRYSYLFDGVPYPLNVAFLLSALYLGTFALISIKNLLDADAQGKAMHSGKYMKQRILATVSVMIVTVLFCALSSMPGVFYLPSVLSITSFNLFLLDRTNPGPMISFTVFSSLMLMWWMYRTFSFIVVDLPVLGETEAVSTPVVAIGLLWSYVLGCLAFALSFAETKVPLMVVLFMHASQVTWIEHVLYSQKEANTYPAVYVGFTTAVGVLLAHRLYKNEVLGPAAASLLASCYLAKGFTFLVEVTGSYYQQEREGFGFGSSLVHLEITGGWWMALAAGYVFMVFEVERQRRVEPGQARRLVYVFVLAAAGMTLASVVNVQRAVYEFWTQNYVSAKEVVHIAPGTALVTFSLLTHLFLSRHQGRYPFMRYFATVSKLTGIIGGILLVAQPSRVSDTYVTSFDYDIEGQQFGRAASAIGLSLVVGGCLLPIGWIPLLLRIPYWACAALSLSLGTTLTLLPLPTFPLFACVGVVVFFTMLTVDLTHFRVVPNMVSFVVYSLSVCGTGGAFIALGRASKEEMVIGNEVVRWEIHEQGRLRLLAITAATQLFLSILLKCRVTGKSLLPGSTPLTQSIANQTGVIVNYSAVLAVTVMSVLNFWGSDSEPGLYVVASLFLLLLADDGYMFFSLQEGNFQYFPPLLCSVCMLWLCLLFNTWQVSFSKTGFAYNIVMETLFALPVAASHVSLLIFLWRGRHRDGVPGAVVLATVVVNVVWLLASSSKTIQWMAIIGICGQCARLFDKQLNHLLHEVTASM